MPDYGKLSNRSLDDMIAGARVEVAPYKQDPMDFVLWKPSKPDEPGWDSPWGTRPAAAGTSSARRWSAALLGETFDIHGGGIDLVFPHHENEIAQSRCAFHTKVMANYWMHNGFLQVEGEKMSKSLGNFVTIRELLEDWPGEVLRFNMLRTHYRQPIDWTVRGLENAPRYSMAGTMLTVDVADPALVCADADARRAWLTISIRRRRLPRCMSLRCGSDQGRKASGSMPQGLARSYGFDLAECRRRMGKSVRRRRVSIDESKVVSLIDARNAARKAKDFKESDRIRDELAAMGVVLKDSKDGTTWEIAR